MYTLPTRAHDWVFALMGHIPLASVFVTHRASTRNVSSLINLPLSPQICTVLLNLIIPKKYLTGCVFTKTCLSNGLGEKREGKPHD